MAPSDGRRISPPRGAGSRDQPLELQRADHVRVAAVAVLAIARDAARLARLADFVQLVAGGHDDGPDVFADQFVLVFEADRTGLALLDAQPAAPLGQPQTRVAVDHRPGRNGLRKGRVNGRARAQAVIEFAGGLLRWADVPALAAARTLVDVDVAGPLADRDLEIAHVARDLLDLGARVQRDVRVLGHLDHPRREDALRAVEGRERLGQARHLAADRRFAFDQRHRHSRVGDVQGGLDAGHPAADDQRLAGHGDLDRFQGPVVADFGHGDPDQIHRFGRGASPFGMDPRAVLADVRHLDQVRIQARVLRRFAERLQVHVRRAGGDHDAVQLLGGDRVTDQLLARIGTHVLVDPRATHARQVGRLFRHALHVDIAGDVLATPAGEYADPSHGRPTSSPRSAAGCPRPQAPTPTPAPPDPRDSRPPCHAPPRNAG